jgi:hypothetical protein
LRHIGTSVFIMKTYLEALRLITNMRGMRDKSTKSGKYLEHKRRGP